MATHDYRMSIYDALEREVRNLVLADLAHNDIEARRADLTIMVVELQNSLYKVFCSFKNSIPLYEITYLVEDDRLKVYTFVVYPNNPFFKE